MAYSRLFADSIAQRRRRRQCASLLQDRTERIEWQLRLGCTSKLIINSIDIPQGPIQCQSLHCDSHEVSAVLHASENRFPSFPPSRMRKHRDPHARAATAVLTSRSRQQAKELAARPKTGNGIRSMADGVPPFQDSADVADVRSVVQPYAAMTRYYDRLGHF
jgi:hypothetical protein